MRTMLSLDWRAILRFLSIYRVDKYLQRYYETGQLLSTGADVKRRTSLAMIFLVNEIMAALCLFAYVFASPTATPEWNYLAGFAFPSIYQMPDIYYLEGCFFFQVINYFFYNFYIKLYRADEGRQFLQMIIKSKDRFLLGGGTFDQLKRSSFKYIEIGRIATMAILFLWAAFIHIMFISRMWPYHRQMSWCQFGLGLLTFHLMLTLFILTMCFFIAIGIHFTFIAIVGIRVLHIRTNQVVKFLLEAQRRQKRGVNTSKLKRFLRENIESIKFLNMLNVFVGVPFTVFVVINGPMNSTLSMSLANNNRIEFSQKIGFWTFSLGQLFFLFVVHFILAMSSRRFHRPFQHLCSPLAHLQQCHLRTRLHLSHALEHFHTKRPYGFVYVFSKSVISMLAFGKV